MQAIFRSWSKWSLANLVIVAAVGVALRYKIVLPLPFIDHKNLLHGHSHFAFSGWVSMALFSALVSLLSRYQSLDIKKYQRLFIFGQLANFGMLFSFPFGGYTPVSIFFSTLSVVFSYFFAWNYHKDLKKSTMPPVIQNWFRGGLFYYAISSLGAFSLAYLMATHSYNQNWYIGSVYFFLHFQYNGWFLFALLGLVLHQFIEWRIFIPHRLYQWLFYSFFISCLPAYFLSALWMNLPQWMVLLAVAAVILHWISYFFFIKVINRSLTGIRKNGSLLPRILWTAGIIAFTSKLLLQSLSLIPSLSYLAFGFRPIVIGYLHLVLLGMVSLPLIGYLLQQSLLQASASISKKGVLIFLLGVILNEIFLMLQGILAIQSIYIQSINYLLLATAIVLFAGAFLFFKGQFPAPKETALQT